MKVKVIVNAVQDKFTGATYAKGKIFELDDERAAVAIAKGYVEEVKNAKSR